MTGEAKRKRDNAIRRFALEHPQYTHHEIAAKFGFSRPLVSRILAESRSEIPKSIKEVV